MIDASQPLENVVGDVHHVVLERMGKGTEKCFVE